MAPTARCDVHTRYSDTDFYSSRGSCKSYRQQLNLGVEDDFGCNSAKPVDFVECPGVDGHIQSPRVQLYCKRLSTNSTLQYQSPSCCRGGVQTTWTWAMHMVE